MSRGKDAFWSQHLARRSWACLLPFAACLLAIPYVWFPSLFPFCDGTQGSCREHLASLLEYLGSLQPQGVPTPLVADDLLAISTFPLHQRWTSANGLYLVLCIAAVLGSAYGIWRMLELDERDAGRRSLSIAFFILLSFGVAFLLNFLDPQNRSLWGDYVYNSHTQRFNLAKIREAESFFEWISLGSACCLGVASALTLLLPPNLSQFRGRNRNDEEARYLALQMRCLRYLLYGAAVLLVTSQVRIEAVFHRVLAPLHPLPIAGNDGVDSAAVFIFRNLEAAFSNQVARLGVLNTLLLCATYVPAAIILQRRASQLAEVALRAPGGSTELPGEGTLDTGENREAWKRDHGLAVSFKDMLPRLAAVLAPLLSGPVGELIARLSS